MLLKILQNKSDLKAVYVIAQKWYLAQKVGLPSKILCWFCESTGYCTCFYENI